MDTEQTSNRNSRRVAVAFQLMAIGFFFVTLWLTMTSIQPPAKMAEWVIFDEVVFFLGYFVSTFVHECGHVRAGLKGGMQFRQMSVGPVTISRSNGKTDIFVNRRLAFGGFAYMILPEEGDATSILEQFIRGGPLASLTLTTVLTIIFVISYALEWTPFAFCVGSGCAASVFSLTGSAFAYTARGMTTDALVLKQLSQPGPQREVVVANFLLSKEFSAGIPAQDWPESAIKTLLAGSQGAIEKMRAYMMAYSYYSAKEDRDRETFYFDLARKIVKDHAGEVGLMAHGFWLAEALRLAEIDKDVASARERLRWAKSKAEIFDFSRYTALAAIAVQEGNRTEAEKQLKAATDALDRSVKRTGMSRDGGQEVLDRLRRHLIETEVLANPSAYLTEQ